jgi:hypothetical protein
MLTIKDILKKLEKIEDNQDKLNYLYGVLDEIEDEELSKEIKEIIKKLEESLESKLGEVEIPQVKKITREIDLNELEQDVEQVQRNLPQRQTPRPDLAIRQNEGEETEFNYSSISNYSTAQLYSPQSFDYQTLQRAFDTGFIEQSLVRENILNPERTITDIEKENLNKKLRETMPGSSEERILMYQAKITEDLKKDEKIKYVPRLK